MINQPFVSFIVPVYNTAEFLPVCVDSVLNQTCGDWELILINDGSTDSSGVLCDNYVRSDDRIIVIHKENSGQFPSRLIGIENATGLYCTGLDSDDYLDTICVETLKKTAKTNPSDIVCWRMSTVSRECGAGVLPSSGPDSGYINPDCYRQYVSRSSDHSFCNKLIKTDILKRSFYGNVPDSRRSVDYIQICPSLCMAKSVYSIENVLYYYRQVSDSVTHVVSVKHILDILNSEKCIFEIVSHYGKLNEEFEKNEYICLAGTMGYELKRVFRSVSIGAREVELIRRHSIFGSMMHHVNFRNCTPDQVLFLRLFYWGFDNLLMHKYGHDRKRYG